MKLIEWKPEKPNLRSMCGCLLILGVPREEVYAPINRKTGAIYNRLSKLDIWHLARNYYKKSIKEIHPDRCPGKYAEYRVRLLNQAIDRVEHLLEYRPSESIPWEEVLI